MPYAISSYPMIRTVSTVSCQPEAIVAEVMFDRYLGMPSLILF